MQPLFKPRLYARGETLWAAGSLSLLWHVRTGTVALNFGHLSLSFRPFTPFTGASYDTPSVCI